MRKVSLFGVLVVLVAATLFVLTTQASAYHLVAHHTSDVDPTTELAPNTLSGQVRLPAGAPFNGAPVENVNVTAQKVQGSGWEQSSTDAGGVYTLTLDMDGWWAVSLGSLPHPIYQDYARPLDWKRQLNIITDTVQDFVLMPISSTITGTVSVTGTGELVQSRMVKGVRTDGGHDTSDYTDNNGIYELRVTTGTYTVSLAAISSSSYGYAPPFGHEGQPVTVSGASVGQIDLWMTPLDKAITGTVTDKSSGQPIGDARLDLKRTDGLYYDYNLVTLDSGLTGTYAISVTSGVYEVSLDAYSQPAGYGVPTQRTQIVTVTDSSLPNVNFQLLPLDKAIRGQVTDKDNGNGVSDVNLRLDLVNGSATSTSANSDASGHYTFTVSEGVYDVNLSWNVPISYARPLTTTQRVTVTTGDISGVDFVLLPKNKSISGQVTAKSSQVGVEGVEMRVSPGYVNTTTNGTGYYTFTNLAEGKYTVYVNDVPSGYIRIEPSSRQVELTSTHKTDVDFQVMAADKKVAGHVRDADGHGVEGVSISANAYDTEYNLYLNTTSDPSGAYSFSVPAGYFSLWGSLPSSHAGNQQLRTPASRSDVDFVWTEKSQHIMGQVTDFQGHALKDASIYADYHGPLPGDSMGGYSANTHSDATGHYTLTLSPGNYTLSSHKNGFPEAPYRIVSAGGSAAVTLTHPQGFEVRGRVTTTLVTSGVVGLPDVYISANNKDECTSSRHDQSAQTNADGYYTLTVDAGTYQVSAYKDRYGYEPGRSLSITADYNGMNFEMSLAPYYAVTGVVRYANGQAVSNASVNIFEGPVSNSDWIGPSDSGLYALEVPSGTYGMRVSIDNWPNPAVITGLHVTTHTYQVNFTVPAAYTVTGAVLRSNGQPWAGASVTADDQSNRSDDEYDQTDAEGAFTFRVYQGGSYRFYVDRHGYPVTPVSYTRTVTGDITGLDFQFGRPVTVTGTVKDAAGKPVANARISLTGQDKGHAQNTASTYTFYDGSYILLVAEGSYSATASSSSFYLASATQNLAVSSAGLNNVNFTLIRCDSRVSGRVTHEQKPVYCGVPVTVKYPSGATFGTAYTTDDRYGQADIGSYWFWLPVGDWHLFAGGYDNTTVISRVVKIESPGAVITGQDFILVPSSVQHNTFLPLIIKGFTAVD